MADRRRRRSGARLVSLASDVGGVYAAQMRAVLLATVPPERIVDLTHELRPGAIGEAAFVLRPILARFPRGAVHVVVVDPGVGGRRRAIAIACRDGSVLVGPDNGVLAPLARELGGGRAFRLDPRRVGVASRVGTTFDGRDLFAPAAARLAEGVPAARLGAPTTYRRLDSQPPHRAARSAAGTVAHIDRFGNVLTDLPSSWLPPRTSAVRARVGRRSVDLPLLRSYEAAGPRRLVALRSSFGTVEIAVRNGDAARRLGVRLGTPVRLSWMTADGRRPARRNRK